MIKAYHLYTGQDGHSQVVRGSIVDNVVVPAESILFEESPPHSQLDWHNAPKTQYVITLSGVLEFTIHGGGTFTVHPGDVLIAEDTSGTGHKWRLTNDEPWRRLYVVFNAQTKISFRADETQ